MAARRMLIVLAILFAISIAAAAIAPQRRTALTTTSTTTTTVLDAPPASAGDVVDVRLLASVASPETVRASVGDQLNLTISADEPLEVEIHSLGLIANADPAAPALFNVLLDTPGPVAITDAATGHVIGRLVVKP